MRLTHGVVACVLCVEAFVIGIKVLKTVLHHSLKALDCLIYSGTVADTTGGCPLLMSIKRGSTVQ